MTHFAPTDDSLSRSVSPVELFPADPADAADCTVSEVVAAVLRSRRALELRFLHSLGRSPAAKIRRVRLTRATELLAETDWPISRIVTEAGFGRVEVMNRVFRRELGQTPGSYRKSQG